MAVIIDQDTCIGCAACESACPLDAISVADTATVDEDICCECGACISSCPMEAISL